MKWRNLPPLQKISDSIDLCDYQGQTLIRINHSLCQGAICLHGGHLIDFQPTNKDPIIWLSENTLFQTDKAIRGGVPICWPWFGKAENPSHGFARTQEWQLDAQFEDEMGVTLELVLTDNTESLSIWANHFHNRLIVHFGESAVEISLTTTNTDKKSWLYGGALHSYLNVNDIHQVTVSQLGDQFFDGTQSMLNCLSDGTLTINKEIDRIYGNAKNPVKIKDETRTLLVEHTGGDSVVVWNPWVETCKNMSDMTDDGYKTMICVEAAQPETSIQLEPQQSHTLYTRISVAQ
jgi:glucose-6-phosphate 1-epimerase